jgi:hypothetical protein
MKNLTNQIEKKESKKIDSLNLENVKVNVSKGLSELTTKESKTLSQKDLYLLSSDLSSEERKQFRQKIRRDVQRFISDILGKDRKESERTDAIQKFLSFYSKNWRITDFKLENFTQIKNESDLKEIKNLLDYVKSTLE